MKNIKLLDGASGTRLWELAAEAGLEKKSTWNYNLECPELVSRIGREYIEAGSDIIYSNTFSANGPDIRPGGLYEPRAVISAGVAAAKAAAAGTDAKVALDIGPLATMLKPMGTLSESEAAEIYEEIISGGMDGNPDMIVLETFMDVKMLKIACEIASECRLPVLCSMSFGQRGRTIMGDSPESMIKALEPFYPAAVGINCSFGPKQSLEVFAKFAEATDMPLLFKPNAGMPVNVDGTEYPYTAEIFAEECRPALERVSYIGSCCGSNPDYIRALAAII